MLIRYPAYYDGFSCIADRCTDSCCKEWEVLVDEKSAARYRAMEGTLGDALRASLYREGENIFLRLTAGRCPMWRADGLCRIQAECGHDALCQTCRDFPRLTHDYGDFLERDLTMSCPEAARLIFSQPDAPMLEMHRAGGEEPAYDREDMRILLQTRDKALHILADERFTVPQSLALLLLYGAYAQSMLDGVDADWDESAALETAAQWAQIAPARELLQFYGQLEILTDAWRERLRSPAPADTWDARLRTLARYGVRRYWLQAISDFDVAARAKTVVLSCITVHLLGGDTVQTAQLYAKEIENSDENIERLLDAAYDSPALTDRRVLGYLQK